MVKRDLNDHTQNFFLKKHHAVTQDQSILVNIYIPSAFNSSCVPTKGIIIIYKRNLIQLKQLILAE